MFRNKEVKQYTILYWSAFAIIGILLYFGIQFSLTQVEAGYTDELLRVISQESIREQGLDLYQPSDYSKDIQNKILLFYLVIYLFFTVAALIGYLLGLKLYRIPISMIQDIRQLSGDVLDGNYERKLPMVTLEGDTGQFYTVYQKMVTAIQQSREDEEKEKLFLKDLIADISHQLKTPLATLTIYQDLLSNPTIPDAKRQELLGLMGEQLTRMEWLVLSLLKLARLEAGAIAFQMQNLPILPTIQAAVQNVHMLCDAKNQHVRIECQPETLVVHDREWIAEALTNILKNATEYAPADSRIEVRVTQSPVTTTIHIKDYGIGISPEDQMRVFKRFYRAKSDVNENSIGIGLSLSKSIVEGHKGDITVESVQSEYTCFIITFYHI